jgi:hypothetical protein
MRFVEDGLRPIGCRAWRHGAGWQVAAVTVGVVLAGASTGCSTTPPEFGRAGILVVGMVRRAGQPVAAIAVRVYSSTICREPALTAPPVFSDPTGRYRFQEFSAFAPGTVFCGLARAFFFRNGVEDSVTVRDSPIRVAELAPDDTPLDSTVVDIDLPVP